MLIFLLIFIKFNGLGTVPIETKHFYVDASARRFDRLISSVDRNIGESDIIHPSVCPSSCEHLHQAKPYVQNHTDINYSIKECSCICPLATPSYVSTVGKCVDRLNDCSNTIRWKSINFAIPVVQLQPHTIVLPDAELDFRGAGIRTSSRGADEWNCSIKKIMYENLNTKWRSIAKERGIFQLTSSNGKPIVYFGGTEFDASFLTGAVVMIKLDCKTFMSAVSAPFCISLRIAGTSGTSSHFDHKRFDSEEPGWRVESTFLLIIVALIVIVLIITLVVWNICWGIKKRKLISDFQMQFVQQYKHQNQILQQNGTEFEEIEEQEILQSHSQSLNRKRLIFSSEYFDSAQMTHPSPLAIQFLYDLRRVVDVAKERIRQRRFIPALPVIIEDVENEIDYVEAVEGPVDIASSATPESSPRSEQKSVDSGRESRDESEEDEETAPGTEGQKEISTMTQSKVSDIVKSFEKSAPRPSYVPIMLNSSMRKKKPLKVASTTHVDSPEEVAQAFRSRIKAPTAFTDKKSPRERKGYAVFPSDGTFNKSLPRRGKRQPHAPLTN
ncbi:Shavenoid isoform B-like N-terminal domain-containing protein [Caenorhabditis elegans]|uniref:Protein kinase domain-containing protein n=1 Tax=Caenorhabditis elegans TaxID=6239 RepID=O62194_CAEEL|nr:Protein kinase domain-containing protein [Caenorhabditis elegans]CAB07196.3 Protein kinase domain-containing protein [Caenorhabditis elegans]|eukprot:NP_001021435.1 Uncharacterized protein CELE_F31C3.6 [Caenorhabditis elegans]